MSKEATNENREHIDESNDESNIDWNGFGELVWKSYQERLKNGIPPANKAYNRRIERIYTSKDNGGEVTWLWK